MRTYNIQTATLYEADGKTIASMYSVATSTNTDLTPTDDWIPHFWFDQTYGLLIDLVRRTVSVVQPSVLKQWRMTGVI